MIWPNVPRPTAGMVAPVLSLKEVGADMTDKLEEVGGKLRSGTEGWLKYPPTLGQYEIHRFRTARFSRTGGYLHSHIPHIRDPSVDYVYIAGKARVCVAQLTELHETASRKWIHLFIRAIYMVKLSGKPDGTRLIFERED